MAAADKEREARRTHLQRAILDLRSQQASELARELLVSHRPTLSANTAAMLSAASSTRAPKPQPARRTASARTRRDCRPPVQWIEPELEDYNERDAYLLRLQNAEDVDINRPQADVEPQRAASADCRPRRPRKFERDMECDGPRVTVTDQQAKPFTDLVRLQRPGVTRQNWDRVRAKAQQNQATAAAADVKHTSCDAAVSSDHRPPVHG